MTDLWTRRNFVTILASSLGAFRVARAAATPQSAAAIENLAVPSRRQVEMTIQDVVDAILRAIPGAPVAETVDTFKAGDPTQIVAGVATTFLATSDVIERAAAANANLIITHEPTFYNHFDNTEWLEHDSVYSHKIRLLDRHGMAVWRFHDYWHMHRPDGILKGLLRRLEWEEYAASNVDRTELPSIIRIPTMTLAALVALFKEKLAIHHPLQVIGEPDMPCHRVGLLPGAYGGRSQIEFLGQADFDVLVVGEINEWETSIYVRDAISAGSPRALVMLGHVNSEEPGMAWLAEWLRDRIPGLPVVHIPTNDAFRLL